MATVNTMIDTSVSEGGSLKSDPNSKLAIDVTPGSILGQIKFAAPDQKEIPKQIKSAAPAQREVLKQIKLAAPAQREVLKQIKLAAPAQRRKLLKRIKLAAPAQKEKLLKRIKLAAPAQREDKPKRIKLADIAQREEKPKRIKLIAPAQREEIPKRIILVAPAQREEILKEVVSVKSDKDLLLRTTINKYGKKIEFKAADNYNGFTGKIGVTFPPFAVLGEEKVFLEIVPESFVHAYNETSKKLKSGVPEIITPILHIDRENDTSFLRDVEVSFPVFPKFRKILEKCQSSEKLLVENGQILLRESKFCPIAVGYDEFKGILQALRVGTDFSLVFRKLGVYLLVEQFSENEFVFDLRPFRDEEEHRAYRMDEKKTFRMIINPQHTDSSIYKTRVSITVQEPAALHNNKQFRNVEGNEINFTFPNPEFDIDSTNKRKVTVEANGLAFFEIKFLFESALLEKQGIDGIIEIPLHSETELQELSTGSFKQSKKMLLEFLNRLSSNWARFLVAYLDAEIRNMEDFIGRDIRFSLQSSVLNWSETIKRRLKMETDLRKFQEVSCREQLVETMLKNYQSSNDLLEAKVDIFKMFKKVKVLASNTKYSRSLQPESRNILASALMYVPETRLRNAMKEAFFPGKLFSLTTDVKKFIFHPEEPMEET